MSKKLQFSFTHRLPTSTSEPRTAWGRMGNDRVCLLYFDFDLDEKSIKPVADGATAELKFSQDVVTRFELTDVAPADEIKHTSEQQYTQHFDINPSIDAGVGGGSLGSYGEERVFDGLPNWRFKGSLCVPRPTQAVSWTWTRGGHYKYSRGVPIIKIGVIGKDPPDHNFIGAVTMTLQPRYSWRRTEKHEFHIDFAPPNPPRSEDLSARVDEFQRSVGIKDTVQAQSGSKPGLDMDSSSPPNPLGSEDLSPRMEECQTPDKRKDTDQAQGDLQAGLNMVSSMDIWVEPDHGETVCPYPMPVRNIGA
ncbi:hypothetical protein N7520_001490 [Penicillium odoratum]|uniref:uncharacterized protein n=1 Tax=Penicillium odoratum TaxID=1167516 RepID=UPI0025484E95|nr:uncharacterized protein N7520_001490 [Penicillium odoratum]KAJ5778244.1 hypothetical protein N7520_001490 [Penicillium odoratum]